MSSTCLVLVQPSYSSSTAEVRRCKKWRYIPSPAIDEQIRNAYMLQRQGDRQALKSVAKRLGWTIWAVSRRGAELGVSRAKENPWSEEEERILVTSGHLTWSAVQKRLARAGYHRTYAGVALKMKRLRVKSNLDGYSACSLALALGVDVHKVLTWMRRGLLKGERRDTQRTPRQGGDTWWIPNKEVKRFVLRAPDEIDLARVEKFWFLELLTEGKICR